MNKIKKIFFSLIILLFIHCVLSNETDSNKVIIKKGTGKIPPQYNVSDVKIIKSPKLINLNVLKVTIDIPVFSMLLLKITDSTEKEISNLIHDKQVSPGTYVIQWQMGKYPAGRYWCEFETEHFIYRKDFYLK